MALTVPLMLSAGGNLDGIAGSAHFSERNGCELIFDLRVAIPVTKLVEALLRYQNHTREGGQWEALPDASPTFGKLPTTAKAQSVNEQRAPLPRRTSVSKAAAVATPKTVQVAPPTKTGVAASQPPGLMEPVTRTAETDGDHTVPQQVLTHGASWNQPLRSPAAELPFFRDEKMRWHRGDHGLVAWNGAQPYDPPLADETRLMMVTPRRLSVKPLTRKLPSESVAVPGTPCLAPPPRLELVCDVA